MHRDFCGLLLILILEISLGAMISATGVRKGQVTHTLHTVRFGSRRFKQCSGAPFRGGEHGANARGARIISGGARARVTLPVNLYYEWLIPLALLELLRSNRLG